MRKSPGFPAAVGILWRSLAAVRRHQLTCGNCLERPVPLVRKALIAIVTSQQSATLSISEQPIQPRPYVAISSNAARGFAGRIPNRPHGTTPNNVLQSRESTTMLYGPSATPPIKGNPSRAVFVVVTSEAGAPPKSVEYLRSSLFIRTFHVPPAGRPMS